MTDFEQCARELMDAGVRLYRTGLVPATSGNFSCKLNDSSIAITVSGSHKGELTENDIMVINSDGEPLDSNKKPSAEVLLHTQIYRNIPEAGAVLHPHMMNAIVLARKTGGDIHLSDYELLKALDGIKTHEAGVYIPVFANDQNIARLASKVQTVFDDAVPVPAYIIDGHGLYTWGRTVADALRHIEALDYLFETELQLRSN